MIINPFPKWKVIAFCLQVFFFSPGCSPGRSQLPNFDLMLPDSISFIKTADIDPGKPCVMIYYAGDCGGCHEETKAILTRINEFRETRLVFVTIEPFGELKRFVDYFSLWQYRNITVGIDTAHVLPKFLHARNTPYVLLADEKADIKRIYTYGPPVDTILYVLKN